MKKIVKIESEINLKEKLYFCKHISLNSKIMYIHI